MTLRRAGMLAAIVVAAGGGVTALQAFGDTPATAGEYVGLSAQRLPFRLTVDGDGQTLSLDVTWAPVCREVQRTVRSHAVPIADDGTFAWEGQDVEVVDGGDGDEYRSTYRLQGRVDADGTLSGIWHAEIGTYNDDQLRGQACSSGDVAFSVRQGGSTEQPAPHEDPSGRLEISTQRTPELVAVGAGRTWLLSQGAPAPTGSRAPDPPTVQQIDPRTGGLGADVKVSVSEYNPNLFVAGEGAAWLLSALQPFRLLRVDAKTQQLGQTRAPARDAHPTTSAVAAGSHGVWLAQSPAPAAGGRLVRIDPRTGRAGRSIRLALATRRGCRPDPSFVWDVATGKGAVWVTASTSLKCRVRSRGLIQHHTLTQVDPRTDRVTHTFNLGHDQLPLRGLGAPIAVGPGGVFGVTCLKLVRGTPDVENLCGRARLQRLDVRAGPRTVAALPTGIVVGLAVSRKAYWVSEQLGSGPGGALIRIDRVTKRRTTVLRTTGKPSNVALGDGAVWIADPAQRRVLRIPE